MPLRLLRRGGSTGPQAPWTWSSPCTFLHYAGSAEKLLRFLKVARGALRPGGRLVGFNDNVLNPPRGKPSPGASTGIVKTGPRRPHRGGADPLPDHELRRHEFRVRQLLREPGDLSARLRRSGVSRVPLAGCFARPPPSGGNPLLGRLPGEPSGHRLRGEQVKTGRSAWARGRCYSGPKGVERLDGPDVETRRGRSPGWRRQLRRAGLTWTTSSSGDSSPGSRGRTTAASPSSLTK